MSFRTFAHRALAIPMIALVAAAAAPAASAQQPGVPSDHARVRAALDAIQRDNAWTLEQQVSICEIPAPPFHEAQRAAEFVRRLEAFGLRNVRIDAEGNVIAERPGAGTGPTVMLSGHLDTVFPEGTDVSVRREGTRYHGPGIGDDCRGLAVVLAVARSFQQANVQTNGTVYFVGTVGEEGAGNLRGVRHLFTREFPNREIDYFISVDGTGYGTTNGAVGSHRYRVSYLGPGGHSYGAFGMPNPIHALGRAIAMIADLQVPSSPRTTFSVGVLEGGTSVNSISAEGIMDLDMRSVSLQELHELDAQVRAVLDRALAAEHARWPRSDVKLTLKIDTIGIRPAGSQPDDAPIVRASLAAASALGLTSRTGSSSTDSNLPISLGIPAITIDGGGTGRGAHSLDEWYDDGTDGYKGPQWAALLVATLAGVR
jgi:acetylornithine deacetylase/succinyl-diaminopimelate desuccinylase-like protein